MNLIEACLFVVEYSNGHSAEFTLRGFSESTARQDLWDSLTEEQKDVVESIECVDVL